MLLKNSPVMVPDHVEERFPNQLQPDLI